MPQPTNNVIRERVCRGCGEKFTGGPRAWYCPKCRELRKAEQKKRYESRKKAGLSIRVGIDRRKCEVCGAEFVIQSPTQKYCKKCAEKAVKAVDAAQSREYCQENRLAINERNRKKYIRKARRCIICGAPIYNAGTKLCSDECRKKMEAIYWQRANYKKGRRKRPPEEAPFKNSK